MESGPESHGILVQHHLARMTGRRFLRARRTDAEQDHGAWRALENVGEVLRAHDRLGEGEYGLVAQEITNRVAREGFEGRVVYDDGIAAPCSIAHRERARARGRGR